MAPRSCKQPKHILTVLPFNLNGVLQFSVLSSPAYDMRTVFLSFIQTFQSSNLQTTYLRKFPFSLFLSDLSHNMYFCYTSKTLKVRPDHLCFAQKNIASPNYFSVRSRRLKFSVSSNSLIVLDFPTNKRLFVFDRAALDERWPTAA